LAEKSLESIVKNQDFGNRLALCSRSNKQRRCSLLNEWINYIRGELKKAGKPGNPQYILKGEYFEMFTDALVLN